MSQPSSAPEAQPFQGISAEAHESAHPRVHPPTNPLQAPVWKSSSESTGPHSYLSTEKPSWSRGSSDWIEKSGGCGVAQTGIRLEGVTDGRSLGVGVEGEYQSTLYVGNSQKLIKNILEV